MLPSPTGILQWGLGTALVLIVQAAVLAGYFFVLKYEWHILVLGYQVSG